MLRTGLHSRLRPHFIALCLGVGLASSSAVAQDPAPAPAAEAPSPAQSRARIQRAQAQLGQGVNDARKARDVVRLNCALAKKRSGDTIAKKASEEVGVVGNRQEAGSSRTLAAIKLRAYADEIEAVVEQARTDCLPADAEDTLDNTQTNPAENAGLNINDPSGVPTNAPRLPPVLDPQWLPTTSGTQ